MDPFSWAPTTELLSTVTEGKFSEAALVSQMEVSVVVPLVLVSEQDTQKKGRQKTEMKQKQREGEQMNFKRQQGTGKQGQ